MRTYKLTVNHSRIGYERNMYLLRGIVASYFDSKDWTPIFAGVKILDDPDEMINIVLAMCESYAISVRLE